jgi:hypothetical protein
LPSKRVLLESIGKKLGLKGMEDWYGVTTHQIRKHGGSQLIGLSGGSPSRLLQTLFPEHTFHLWRFHQLPKDMWERLGKENSLEFLEWTAKQLKLRSLDDWYRVSMKQLQQIAPIKVFGRKNLVKILMESYPEHSWDPSRFLVQKTLKASQRLLAAVVEEVFPGSGTACDPL